MLANAAAHVLVPHLPVSTRACAAAHLLALLCWAANERRGPVWFLRSFLVRVCLLHGSSRLHVICHVLTQLPAAWRIGWPPVCVGYEQGLSRAHVQFTY